MIDFGALVQTYGYPALVVGTMLQGETILLLCGFLAYQGYLSLEYVWLIAAASAAIGDIGYFALGHHYGERLIQRLPAFLRSSLNWAQAMVDRNPTWVLIFMRFVVEMRTILPILCGMSKIKFRRFLKFDIITALLWSAIFSGIGYLFGTVAQTILHRIEHFELILILILCSGGILYYWFEKNRQSRRQP
jgi:membrane protein DedA with SNARE-associated domain